MIGNRRSDQLYLIGVREQAVTDEWTRVTFFTTRRDLTAFACRLRATQEAVILLGPDTDDPEVHSEFNQLAIEIGSKGVGSMRLDYRYPGDRVQCAIDALLACQYLDDEGIGDVLLVGWGFGAAVALAVGSVGRIVSGVAAIEPPDLPECCLQWISGRRLFVVEHDRYSRAELVDWILSGLDAPRFAQQERRAVAS